MAADVANIKQFQKFKFLGIVSMFSYNQNLSDKGDYIV